MRLLRCSARPCSRHHLPTPKRLPKKRPALAMTLSSRRRSARKTFRTCQSASKRWARRSSISSGFRTSINIPSSFRPYRSRPLRQARRRFTCAASLRAVTVTTPGRCLRLACISTSSRSRPSAARLTSISMILPASKASLARRAHFTARRPKLERSASSPTSHQAPVLKAGSMVN